MSSVYGKDNSVGLGSVILVVTFLTILVFGGMIWVYLNGDAIASDSKASQKVTRRVVAPAPSLKVEKQTTTL